jgi:hypothetical protein
VSQLNAQALNMRKQRRQAGITLQAGCMTALSSKSTHWARGSHGLCANVHCSRRGHDACTWTGAARHSTCHPLKIMKHDTHKCNAACDSAAAASGILQFTLVLQRSSLLAGRLQPLLTGCGSCCAMVVTAARTAVFAGHSTAV